MDQLTPPMTNADQLLDSDKRILDALRDHGNLTKGALVDLTGYSENTVYNRLDSLTSAELVTLKHEGTRLFAITEDPRDGQTWTVEPISGE